jgi:hypothetical protein
MSDGLSPAPCGCCTGVTQETPEPITNRPALPAIGYRAGRYATFSASLLASLSSPDFAALGPLRTRDPSDFTIALLDAWAVSLDILTFYQERFANEAFIRTAIDQRSVFELAGLAGYAPSPGVAASAVLAFTLSAAPGSPPSVVIPAGSRVQSVPGPGQSAQVFETSADLTAQPGWNALPAQVSGTWQLSGADTTTWIAGTANNISPGDALLFVRAVAGQPQAAGPADVHYVTAVSPSPATGSTQIWWDGPLSADFAAGEGADTVTIFTFRTKAALYGATAPSPQVLSATIPGLSDLPPGGSIWDYTPNADNAISLDASYPGVRPPPPGQPGIPPQWAVFTGVQISSGTGLRKIIGVVEFGFGSEEFKTFGPGDAPSPATWFFQVTAASETSPDRYTVTAKTTQLTLAPGGQLGLGGTQPTLSSMVSAIVGSTPNITAYVGSTQLTPAGLPITAASQSSAYPWQPGLLAPVYGGTVAVTGGQQIAAGQPVAVSGRALRIGVSGGNFTPAAQAGRSPVTPGQVFIVAAFPPAASTTAPDTTWQVTTLSGVAGTLVVPSLAPAQLLPSQPGDPQAAEAAVVQSVSVKGDITTLVLANPLAGIYDAATVTVNANAVLATNGQTVQEILGSGNAASPALQFTLKQAPLTYVPAPSGNGSVSTLQVWVNNLRWHETASMLTAGPADRVFVTSTNAAGFTVITFGNGTQGARPPTGTANIRALYRTGIGSGGMVAAGQLSQPLDRPQGLSGVTNPGPATGAQDPATAAQARASAPLPTLTIGRVVSLEDYQNYALSFAGIGMAVATWTWFGSIRGVFLTVAGAGGAVLQPGDPVVTALVQAIGQIGDPHVPLQVVAYQRVLFTFSASVLVDLANVTWPQVSGQAWQALTAAFAFGQRALGQGVAASEIIAIIQQVPGVIAVQLQGLTRTGQAPVPGQATLGAAGPQPPLGAELLLLDPATQGQIGQWTS